VHGLEELGFEVVEVDAVSCTHLRRERLPVSHDAACLAANRTKSFVPLDVIDGLIRMTVDQDCAELVVGPDSADPAAEGAVATRRLLGERGKRQSHCAAVT